jgi:hypothetical protein
MLVYVHPDNSCKAFFKKDLQDNRNQKIAEKMPVNIS